MLVITLFYNFINKKNSKRVLKCSISECKSKANQSVKIGFKETRNLCEYHYKLFMNKEEKHSASFSKATKFLKK